MAINEEQCEARRLFMPIAVMEHHQMLHPQVDVYDICERLWGLWQQVAKEAGDMAYRLDAEVILALNARVAAVLGGEPGEFADRAGWSAFLDELREAGSLDEDDGHVCNWIFSQLYWQHLTRFRLATVWILVNALNLQRGRPLNTLSLEKLGSFLDRLSAAGPPIHDGQTFFAQDYS